MSKKVFTHVMGNEPSNAQWIHCDEYELRRALDERRIAADVTYFAFDGSGVVRYTDTLLAWFSATGETKNVKVLLEYGANVDLVSFGSGKTALHYAARSGRYETAKALIEAGANVNARDRHGYTPLDYVHPNMTKLFDLFESKGGSRTEFLDGVGRVLANHVPEAKMVSDESECSAPGSCSVS